MNAQQQDEFAAKVKVLLDGDIKEIDGEIASRLLSARKEALAHYQEKPAPVWVPQWATAAMEAMEHVIEPFNHNLRAGLVLLALLATFAAAVAWQTMSQSGSEIAEIDEALLTDELPINAYLDKGFDSWLKRP